MVACSASSSADGRGPESIRIVAVLTPDAVLFGHLDALAYGVGRQGDPGRSDVKDVTGSHPALNGWEPGHLEIVAEQSFDRVRFDEVPFPGHPAEEDFKAFVDDPLILLENDLPDLYRPLGGALARD